MPLYTVLIRVCHWSGLPSSLSYIPSFCQMYLHMVTLELTSVTDRLEIRWTMLAMSVVLSSMSKRHHALAMEAATEDSWLWQCIRHVNCSNSSNVCGWMLHSIPSCLYALWNQGFFSNFLNGPTFLSLEGTACYTPLHQTRIDQEQLRSILRPVTPQSRRRQAGTGASLITCLDMWTDWWHARDKEQSRICPCLKVWRQRSCYRVSVAIESGEFVHLELHNCKKALSLGISHINSLRHSKRRVDRHSRRVWEVLPNQ